MNPQEVADDMLMALSDNELPAAEAVELRALIAAHPDLQRRYDAFARSRAAAKETMSAFDQRSAIERLSQAVRDFDDAPREKIVRLDARRPSLARAPAWALPLAASLALAVVGFGGFQLGALRAEQSRTVFVGAPAIPQQAWSETLTLAAGDTARTWRSASESGLMHVLASYRLADGGLCRAFEIEGRQNHNLRGLACREGADWRVKVAILDEAPPGEAYVAASAGALAAMDQFLADADAVRLTEAEEAAARAGDWRPRAR